MVILVSKPPNYESKNFGDTCPSINSMFGLSKKATQAFLLKLGSYRMKKSNIFTRCDAFYLVTTKIEFERTRTKVGSHYKKFRLLKLDHIH